MIRRLLCTVFTLCQQYVIMIVMKKNSWNSKGFWSQVNITGNEDCWIWTGSGSKKTGYGLARLAGNKSPTTAHRAAWVYSFGEIQNKELDVLHKCSNRSCVNPAHLYLGTHTENMREAVRRKDYLYPLFSVEEILKIQTHARAEKLRAYLLQTTLDEFSDEKIVGLLSKDNDQEDVAVSVSGPMVCGHPERYVVGSNEGTNFCLMCAYQEADNVVRIIKGAFEKAFPN